MSIEVQAKQLEMFTPLAISEADLVQYKEASPLFVRWAQDRFGSRLNSIADGLKWLGIVGSPEEVLLYLDKILQSSATEAITGISVPLAPLQGDKTHSHAYRRLRNARSPEEKQLDADTYFRLNGVFGHSAFLNGLAGKTPELQMTQGHKWQLPLLDEPIFWDKVRAAHGVWKHGKLSDNYIYGLQDLSQSIRSSVNGYTWGDVYPSLGEERQALWDLLFAFAPREITSLRMYADKISGGDVVATRSLLCWAEGLVDMVERGLFKDSMVVREIKLFPHEFGVSLGRIDAVAMTGDKTKDGDSSLQPTDLNTFLKTLKGDGKCVVYDLKFIVGDGRKGTNILDTAVVKEAPVSSHKSQMERYLSWHPKVKEGYVIYIVDGGLQIHSVLPTEHDQHVQRRRIAANWTLAQVEAVNRKIDQIFVDHILSLRQKNGSPKTQGRQKRVKDSHVFKWQGVEQNPLVAVIEDHRVFTDDTHAFEVISTGDDPKRFIVHADALFSAIGEGRISIRGKKTFCPGHEDRGKPNLHLFKNHLYCFACGITIPLDWGGIPPDYAEITYKARSLFNGKRLPSEVVKENPDLQKKMERQQRTLSAVLEIARRDFFNSPGSDYLSSERKIDPELAFYYGAGYAHLLAAKALRNGVSYDDLVTAGVIELKEYVGKNDLYYILKKEIGMHDGEIMKVLKIKHKDGSVEEKLLFPRDPWEGRVIFPLYLAGMMTSIYGRATPECRSLIKHYKPTTDYSGVKQGGFNMMALTSTTPKVAILEAVIDGLTLATLKQRDPGKWEDMDFISVIGTYNDLIIAEIAGAQKSLYLGWDNDKEGNKSAIKNGEKLEESGRVDMSQVDSFNKLLFAAYPEAANYDDLNSWWMKVGWKMFP